MPRTICPYIFSEHEPSSGYKVFDISSGLCVNTYRAQTEFDRVKVQGVLTWRFANEGHGEHDPTSYCAD